MSEYCDTCGRTFADREDYVNSMLMSGQVISKGKRPRNPQGILDDCGHIKQEHAND